MLRKKSEIDMSRRGELERKTSDINEKTHYRRRGETSVRTERKSTEKEKGTEDEWKKSLLERAKNRCGTCKDSWMLKRVVLN